MGLTIISRIGNRQCDLQRRDGVKGCGDIQKMQEQEPFIHRAEGEGMVDS